MNSDNVYAVLQQLATTPKRGAKHTLLKQALSDDLMRFVVMQTLDPRISYNVTVDKYTGSPGNGTFGQGIKEMFDRLASGTLSGNAARDAVQSIQESLTEPSCRVFECIINKDLACGVGVGIVNEASAGLIFEMPFQRCSLLKAVKLDKFSWEDGVFSQDKADGMFVNITIATDGVVVLASRSGVILPNERFASIVNAAVVQLSPGHQYHGELLVRRDGNILPRKTGNGLLNSVIQGARFAPNERAECLLWDQISAHLAVPSGSDPTPYNVRFDRLQGTLSNAPVDSPLSVINTKIVHSMEEAYAHYVEALADGKEGTIFKDGNAIWRDGTSKQQVKLKLEAECDLVIVGFTEGNGKNKDTFGSIRCQTADGLLETNVSGFTDTQRRDIHKRRDQLINTVMAVTFNDVMVPSIPGVPHSLFLPRCAELRRDKTTADTLQQVIDQMEAAKQTHL